MAIWAMPDSRMSARQLQSPWTVDLALLLQQKIWSWQLEQPVGWTWHLRRSWILGKKWSFLHLIFWSMVHMYAIMTAILWKSHRILPHSSRIWRNLRRKSHQRPVRLLWILLTIRLELFIQKKQSGNLRQFWKRSRKNLAQLFIWFLMSHTENWLMTAYRYHIWQNIMQIQS